MPAGSYQFQAGAIRCTVLSDGYAGWRKRTDGGWDWAPGC
jgi:hypothetical protein